MYGAGKSKGKTKTPLLGVTHNSEDTWFQKYNTKEAKKIKIPSKDELSINLRITHRNKCPTGVALNTQIILKIIDIFSIIDNLLSIYYVPGTGLSALNRSFNLVRSF